MKIQNIKKYYVITKDERELSDYQKTEKIGEIEYIEKEVIPKRDIMREKKSDEELLNDVRYLGKYADYLFQRIKSRNDYQRLGLQDQRSEGNLLVSFPDAFLLGKAQIKKAYLKKVQIWHPDNIKKKIKY
jgi:hypothetical protein